MVNKKTTAQDEEKKAREALAVLLLLAHDLVFRDAKGIFYPTEKGRGLITLLKHTDLELQEELVRERLQI